MNKVIENIGEKVLKEFFDFKNNEYTLEYDEEYGCNEARMDFVCDYNHHTINGSVCVRNGYLVTICVTLEDEYENLEKSVNEYIEGIFNSREWYALCVEDYRDSTMDEWQRNGFRDEADFWHYKLSA